MKKKQLDEIKHGVMVCVAIKEAAGAATYDELSKGLGLDPKSAQKVLADLQKHGYISKDERGFYRFIHGEERTYPQPARYLVIGE